MNGLGIKVSLAGMLVATLAAILLTPLGADATPALGGAITWAVWTCGSLAALSGLGIALFQEGNPRMTRRQAAT